MENHNEIKAVLGNLALKSADIESAKMTRLGGLTNLVYRVELVDENLIVRIPGKGTEEYIDRAVELHNARAAATAAVSAEVLWADAKSGVMISRCIDGIETMSPKLFKSRKGSPARAAHAFR
ncbi:MAG: hypothetical protein JKY99_09060, partial [Rhizobiales bacterium]|nr:hypothetical protein [Hyphomicrobiales bacterium]